MNDGINIPDRISSDFRRILSTLPANGRVSFWKYAASLGHSRFQDELSPSIRQNLPNSGNPPYACSNAANGGVEALMPRNNRRLPNRSRLPGVFRGCKQLRDTKQSTASRSPTLSSPTSPNVRTKPPHPAITKWNEQSCQACYFYFTGIHLARSDGIRATGLRVVPRDPQTEDIEPFEFCGVLLCIIKI